MSGGDILMDVELLGRLVLDGVFMPPPPRRRLGALPDLNAPPVTSSERTPLAGTTGSRHGVLDVVGLDDVLDDADSARAEIIAETP